MKLKSSQFEQGESIPTKYTCDGEDISPPFSIENVPEGAESLTLIVDDPDAPGQTWDHWVVWNISPDTESIPEDSVPGTQGVNDFGKHDYGGPCPPDGEHRYFFKLYALDTKLDLNENSKKSEVEDAMEGHVLEEDELMGVYARS